MMQLALQPKGLPTGAARDGPKQRPLKRGCCGMPFNGHPGRRIAALQTSMVLQGVYVQSIERTALLTWAWGYDAAPACRWGFTEPV